MVAQRPLLRIVLNVVLDGLLAALAVPLARWLADPAAPWAEPVWLPAAGAVCVLIGGLPFRLSQQYWRFAGLIDLMGVAGASVVGAALLALVYHMTGQAQANPAGPAILALTLLVLLGGPRVIYRRAQMRQHGGAGDRAEADRILLVGAGEDADLFLRALAGDRRKPFRVLGLLAQGSRQTGRRIQGHPILGSVDDAPAVLDRLKAEARLPDMLVVAMQDLAGAPLATLLEQADRHGLVVRRAPRPTTLNPATQPHTPDLKPVAIEDLLNRPQVPLDRVGMARLIQGRRVIVTGAGGTIGSELARQVAALGPELLMLLDNGEYALWQIDMELAETHPGIVRRTIIADIRDEARIRAIFETFRPELVFHAAALKHVPMVEANPLEGLLTNVAGTRHVADAARAAGARAMVLISTDKAVNPTSVMGASKRLAEMYCQGLDIAARGAGGGMRCVTVRFGNVLGSTGSVVPLFQRQLERGGPLTVTHPDMQRYFMTVREAVGRRAGRHLRAGHGQAGQDRRSGAPDDPPGRAASRHRRGDPLHLPAARREAVRGAVPRQGTAGGNRPCRIADGHPAHRRPGDRRPLDRGDRRRLPWRAGAAGADPARPAGAGVRAQCRWLRRLGPRLT
jgi:FlaA1/EpsC-like NDP-sugar epimerase